MEYLARLKAQGPNVLVSFPDCPGCQTFGKNRDEALARAVQALIGWLESHLVAGEAPPRPRSRKPAGRHAVPIRLPAILAVRLELRWARHEAGLSQGALARRIGVTRQQVALLESPDSNVTLRTLERVAGAMNLDLDIRLISPRVAAA